MAYISFAICILAGFAATTLLVITDHAYFAIAVLIATVLLLDGQAGILQSTLRIGNG